MATSNTDLGQNLDQLVADFVHAAQHMVLAAVADGLAVKPAAPAKATSTAKRSKPTKRATNSHSGKSSKSSKRRPQAEIAELAERFYDVLYRHPGATMAVLAPKVGASPRELHRPVAVLKQAGRVRTVGERQWTTYFPIARAVEVDAAA